MVNMEDYLSPTNPIRSYEDWDAAINRRAELEIADDFGDEWTDLTKHINEYNRFIDAFEEDRIEHGH